MTTKRIVLAAILIPLIIGGAFGTRLVASLAHLTHQSPLAVLHDLVGGGGSSNVHQASVDLHRINIALYGYGGDGHDGSFLSDSIMVLSIQPQLNGPPEVTEISLPRDWLVPIDLGTADKPSIRYAKINEAYADGMSGQSKQFGKTSAAGAEVANKTLQRIFGITIDHYVGVDFTAFKDAVDAVGGVEVNVQHTFTDYQYPAGECNGYRGQNCGYMTVTFKAGLQHMNGARALIFSRSRHSMDNGEGSDFSRGKRQQLVVAALKQKVVSIGGIGNLPNLIGALGDHVITDMTVSDGEALYSLVKGVDPATVEHVSIDNTNFLYDCGYPYNCGSYYLYAHDNTYATLHAFVAKLFIPTSVTGAHVAVTVKDGSGRPAGASMRWNGILSELGLASTDGGIAPRSTATQVINYGGSADQPTAQWLALYFGVSVTTPATPTPSASVATAKPVATAKAVVPTGVVVILGSAEELSFNNHAGTGA